MAVGHAPEDRVDVSNVRKVSILCRAVSLIVVLPLLPVVLVAQVETTPANLPLADALRIAEAHNPTLRAAQQGVDIAVAEARTAASRPNPVIAIEGEEYAAFRTDRRSFWNDQAVIVRFEQELESAGRRGHRIRAARAGIAVARAETENARRQLHLNVGRTYFALALAQADRAVANAALDEIERVVGLTEARFNAGEVAGVELRRLQVERLGFVDEVLTAELAVRNSRVALLASLAS